LKALIHICCANCLIHPLKTLREEGWETMGFFYNPNIHPYQEYQRRLETVREYEKQAAIQVIYRDEYNLEEFLRGVAFREDERCRFCLHLRLEATAKVAKRSKFDAFTTTLLHSRHQNHELIKAIGETVGKEQGVQFLYRDFRDGWKHGIAESKSLGLYRQNYCGCIYSEKERYLGKEK
jgi:predicted adenine nucleotide alpha hydrolase (AANH) superfamily ATPase